MIRYAALVLIILCNNFCKAQVKKTSAVTSTPITIYTATIRDLDDVLGKCLVASQTHFEPIRIKADAPPASLQFLDFDEFGIFERTGKHIYQAMKNYAVNDGALADLTKLKDRLNETNYMGTATKTKDADEYIWKKTVPNYRMNMANVDYEMILRKHPRDRTLIFQFIENHPKEIPKAMKEEIVITPPVYIPPSSATTSTTTTTKQPLSSEGAAMVKDFIDKNFFYYKTLKDAELEADGIMKQIKEMVASKVKYYGVNTSDMHKWVATDRYDLKDPEIETITDKRTYYAVFIGNDYDRIYFKPTDANNDFNDMIIEDAKLVPNSATSPYKIYIYKVNTFKSNMKISMYPFGPKNAAFNGKLKFYEFGRMLLSAPIEEDE